ncbi:MAG: DUF721 domain-containing protein [Archangiaceae bacterium]|nr:DUF721 domain-containing protein [Archangiaceae bacterium]
MASHRFASLRELMQTAAIEVVKTSGSTAALVPVWAEAVGPQIARNCEPVAWYGDALVISCASAQWVQALASQEKTLIARLSPKLGIRSLRLQLRGAPAGGETPR